MPKPPPFVAFAPSHLAVLALVAALAGGMIWVARSGRWPALAKTQEIALVVLLLAGWPAEWLSSVYMKAVTWETILPVQLCDLASFAAALTLLTKNRLTAELAYFWAMAGTVNGLITPALDFAFPHPAFWAFFLLHGSVVAAAAYVIGGLRLWPRPGAVWRAFGCSVLYLCIILLLNKWLGTNFAFVCEKPETASLMDALGPWPWYVLALIPLSLVIFTVLYTPFYLLRRFGRKGA